MKMQLLQWIKMNATVYLIFVTIFLNISHAARPAAVTINKCCRIGEHMDKAKQCVPGASEKWVPKVYLLARKTYYAKVGEAPQHMKVLEESLPQTCGNPQYFSGSNNLAIISNGSLYLQDKDIMSPPEDYCVDKDAALVCYHKYMDALTLPQILSTTRKCCGPNAAYSKQNATCINLDRDHHLFHAKIIKSPQVEVMFGFPECELHDFAIAGQFSEQEFNDNTGTLIMSTGKVFQANQFCLEHVVDGNVSAVKVFACSDHFPQAEIPVHQNDVRFSLYSIGLLISVFFLAATLAAGFLMPSNHHVLHWRCQTNYIMCLLVGDLLLAITQMAENGIMDPYCTLIAIFMHFSFLAAFFWLNTMCFNIWWTFRDFRPTSMEKYQESCRLRVYHIWAWGVPSFIAILAAILDRMPDDGTFLRPRFGEQRCWFYGDLEILAYFFGPIGTLLFINVLLFLSTVRELTCGRWKPDDVKSSADQHRTALERVCMKLVIVMGLTWVADVLSWCIGGPNYLWYATDLINALQGLFIFLVVGCQPQVWTAMKRMWSSKSGRHIMNTTNGPQHSSSSHGLPSMGESVTNNTFTNTSSCGKVPMETIC